MSSALLFLYLGASFHFLFLMSQPFVTRQLHMPAANLSNLYIGRCNRNDANITSRLTSQTFQY